MPLDNALLISLKYRQNNHSTFFSFYRVIGLKTHPLSRLRCTMKWINALNDEPTLKEKTEVGQLKEDINKGPTII